MLADIHSQWITGESVGLSVTSQVLIPCNGALHEECNRVTLWVTQIWVTQIETLSIQTDGDCNRCIINRILMMQMVTFSPRYTSTMATFL